jgi:hypothetical protein
MKLPYNGEIVTGFVFDGHLRMNLSPLGTQTLVQIARACEIPVELEAMLLLWV